MTSGNEIQPNNGKITPALSAFLTDSLLTSHLRG